jgi:hypothetical protein
MSKLSLGSVYLLIHKMESYRVAYAIQWKSYNLIARFYSLPVLIITSCLSRVLLGSPFNLGSTLLEPKLST